MLCDLESISFFVHNWLRRWVILLHLHHVKIQYDLSALSFHVREFSMFQFPIHAVLCLGVWRISVISMSWPFCVWGVAVFWGTPCMSFRDWVHVEPVISVCAYTWCVVVDWSFVIVKKYNSLYNIAIVILFLVYISIFWFVYLFFNSYINFLIHISIFWFCV